MLQFPELPMVIVCPSAIVIGPADIPLVLIVIDSDITAALVLITDAVPSDGPPEDAPMGLNLASEAVLVYTLASTNVPKP